MPRDVQSKILNAYKVTLEHTRAQANEELIHTLQDYEQEESVRFDQMQQEWEKQTRDPDDVFFAARDRKQEIKEQIRDPQRGLQRQQRGRSLKKKTRR